MVFKACLVEFDESSKYLRPEDHHVGGFRQGSLDLPGVARGYRHCSRIWLNAAVVKGFPILSRRIDGVVKASGNDCSSFIWVSSNMIFHRRHDKAGFVKKKVSVFT